MNEFENKLRIKFEENYEYLKGQTSGHLVTGPVKDAAFLQVQYYLRRNKVLVEHINHSGVRLSLPEMKTPHVNYVYTIDGVVDIAEAKDGTLMYCIKTTDRQSLLEHLDLYRGELSVYTYIYKKIYGGNPTKIAIVTTALPKSLRDAIKVNDRILLERLMKEWQPIEVFDYSEEKVEAYINDFGLVVEKIEGGLFNPPTAMRLSEPYGRFDSIFAIEVCRNCDVRYSCDSYSAYIENKGGDIYEMDLMDDTYIEDNLEDSMQAY